MPWSHWNLDKRPYPCRTAEKAPMNSEELYLYMNITQYLSPETCSPFRLGKDPGVLATEMLIASVATWGIVFLCICGGVKTNSFASIVFVPISFILIFVIMGYYMTLNDGVSGKGMEFYWGMEQLPLPTPSPSGSLYYDPS